MKCHYEVLGIGNAATLDEIKKAYRKLALEWHPDKNLHREDEAKEQFQLLQQAYEILIDPQERAWYDKHKDEILSASGADVYKDDSLDIFQYFTVSCFKGYTDEEKGFYTVYREVFRKIAAEDEPFRDESDVEVPDFGYSYSSYDDVVHNFYAYWQSYCTIKTFSWIEQYNLSDHRRAGAGRHVLRMIEKENKKLRDQHRKQRNEEVRQLVAFVRKRDKRVQAHKKLLEEQTAEKAKKFQDQRKKMIEERQRDLESYQETEWSSMTKYEDHFNEIEANVDNTFGAQLDDMDESHPYCVACDKDFRSEKSLKNHLNSKKHKENVQLLKQVMQEEELEYIDRLSCESSEMPGYFGDDDCNDFSLEEPLETSKSFDNHLYSEKREDTFPSTKQASQKGIDHLAQVSCESSEIPGYFGDDDCNEDLSLDEPLETTSKKKKKKKKKTTDMFNKPESFTDKSEHDIDTKLDGMKLSDDSLCSGLETQNEPSVLKGRKKKKKHTLADGKVHVLSDKESDISSRLNGLPISKNQAMSGNSSGRTPIADSSKISTEQTDPSVKAKSTVTENTRKKIGKLKGPKKPIKAATNDSEGSVDAEKCTTICEKCGVNYNSGNKLFMHLKESGHAIYLGSQSSTAKAPKSKAKLAKTKNLNR